MITKALLLAMIAIESGGNTVALSPSGAKGLMQMTLIAIKEVCIQNVCEPDLDVYDPETNIWLGYRLLDFYLDQAKGDITGALILYNGGYRQYYRYLAGESLTKETADYIISITYKKKYYANCFDRQPSAVFEHSKTIDNVLRRVGAEDGTTLLDIWL